MLKHIETNLKELSVEKIKQYQRSNKLILFVSSKEFFRSNFWLNPKKYLNEFDSCCINYSSLYFQLYNFNFNYFFSIDDDIFEDVSNIFENKDNSLFFNTKSMYQKNEHQSKEIIEIVKKIGNITEDDNCAFNSGTACLHEFMRHGIYKEIHLIGFNLILSSGNITKRRREFMSEKKGIHVQRFKNSVEIAKVLLEHYPETKVYKTYEKSNIPGLESSDTFHTLEKNVINIKRSFKSII